MAQPKPQDSLTAYIGVQKKADAEILRALRDAAKDINARLRVLAGSEAAELERSRLLAIKQAVLQGQAEVFERTGRIIEKRRAEAAARAIQVSGRYDEIAFEAVGREQDARALAAGLEATEARAIDTLVARVTGSRVPLSQRVYNTQAWAGKQLDRQINSALARGLNAQQFAAEIRQYVNPNTPGGTRYAALRLARTEINNAYHAMAIRAAELKPWVTKVEWHISKSHARRDECDQLNGQLFVPADTPRKPHPQCLCYITPVIDDDDDAFLDSLANGEFDEFIDRFAERQGIDVTAPPLPAPVPAPLPTPAPTPTPIVPAVKAVPAKKVAAAKKPSKDPAKVARLNSAPEHPEARRANRVTGAANRSVQTELNFQAQMLPDVMGTLHSVVVGSQEDPSWLAHYNPVLRQIVLGQRIVEAQGPMHRNLQRQKWFSQCGHDHGNVESVTAHEFGHHAHRMMDSLDYSDRVKLVNEISDALGVSASTRTFDDNQKEWMTQHESLIKEMVSKYAAASYRELVAEIWAEYSTNPDARPHIKQVGKVIQALSEKGARAYQREQAKIDARARKRLGNG